MYSKAAWNIAGRLVHHGRWKWQCSKLSFHNQWQQKYTNEIYILLSKSVSSTLSIGKTPVNFTCILQQSVMNVLATSDEWFNRIFAKSFDCHITRQYKKSLILSHYIIKLKFEILSIMIRLFCRGVHLNFITLCAFMYLGATLPLSRGLCNHLGHPFHRFTPIFFFNVQCTLYSEYLYKNLYRVRY